MGTAAHVRINDHVYLYKDKAPFVPSGKSTMGALEYDKTSDLLRCHECGEWFQHLGAHVTKAHSVTAKEYKMQHGLRRRTALIAASVKARLHRAALRNGANPVRIGRKTRIRRGGSIQTKVGVQHEKRNERGSCRAQTLESIERLARHLGRTPSIDEAQAAGINMTSTRDLFGMSWSSLMEHMGLSPRKPGKRASIEERMEWPEDYFRVRIDDLKSRSPLG